MFPGTTTKLSETVAASTTTIDVKTDLIRLTGSTAIATLNPFFGGGFSGICILVPVDGTLGLLTTGNIAIAVTMAQKRATVMVYSRATGVWYPGAIS
jgi:hypothetical protein